MFPSPGESLPRGSCCGLFEAFFQQQLMSSYLPPRIPALGLARVWPAEPRVRWYRASVLLWCTTWAFKVGKPEFLGGRLRPGCCPGRPQWRPHPHVGAQMWLHPWWGLAAGWDRWLSPQEAITPPTIRGPSGDRLGEQVHVSVGQS